MNLNETTTLDEVREDIINMTRHSDKGLFWYQICQIYDCKPSEAYYAIGALVEEPEFELVKHQNEPFARITWRA